MDSLPASGRIECTICHSCNKTVFDQTKTGTDSWRITFNPLAWGNSNPEVVVLGFSKGPTQAGALSSTPHDQIAYKGGRTNLAKILHHVGLIEAPESRIVDHLISDPDGRFHFGSLVRCTVERNDNGTWKGTGGGMLDKFVKSEFGEQVATNCTIRFLRDLPISTKLVLLLGMGSKMNYVKECKKLMETARGRPIDFINDVSYTDRLVTFVHTEHFQSQGALIPNWLGKNRHPRQQMGILAREGVTQAMATVR